jgi:CDP-diacylglycerol--glycerol-3-phosphate 3-phosphatidyltransferase
MTLPNQLTVLRIILTPIFLYLFLSNDPLLIQISLAVFLVAALTDWGKFWDPLADKILTSTAFLGFVFVGLVELWMVILIIFRDLIVTLLRIYAESRGYNFVTSYYAKWKTVLQMVFLYYLLLLYGGLNTIELYTGNEQLFNLLSNKDLIYGVMLVITIITVHSGITYVLNNKHLIKKLFNETNKLV